MIFEAYIRKTISKELRYHIGILLPVLYPSSLHFSLFAKIEGVEKKVSITKLQQIVYPELKGARKRN